MKVTMRTRYCPSIILRFFRGFLQLLLVVGLLGTTPLAWAGDGSINSNGTVDFDFNFRFPPNTAQIAVVKDQIQRASGILCDATDGQLRFRNVRLTAGGTREAQAAYWYYAEPGRSGVSFWGDGSGLRRLGTHITLFQRRKESPYSPCPLELALILRR